MRRIKNRPGTGEVMAAINYSAFWRSELPSMPLPRYEGGWADGGLCVFHDDHKRGNFRVNLTTGRYFCFSCGASGDVFQYVMACYGMSFNEALEKLANEWGRI
jgi:hypothetical protein